MKSVVPILFTSAIIFFFGLTPASAQKKVKHAVIPPKSSVPETPQVIKYVAIDAPPPFAFNVPELKFGSQGVGVQSCMYVTITNMSPAAQTMARLFTDDEKNYTIPSPSHQMLPISIQPRSNLTISVCFKPAKTGEYKSRLVIKTPADSVVIPISGKGIKPEDVGKLPQTELTVISPKKKNHTWNFKLQLAAPAKITLQILDDLGVMKVAFLTGGFKNEGLYEFPFDGLDKGKHKLPSGKYYLRCVVEDIARSNTPTKFTKVITIPN